MERLGRLAMGVLVVMWAVRAVGGSGAFDPVVIDYFFEPGCQDCARVRDEVLPVLEYRCGGLYMLQQRDTGLCSNVVVMAGYQEALAIGRNEPVMMVVDGLHALNGINPIREGLISAVEAAVVRRLETGPPPAALTSVCEGAVERRFEGFSWPMVIGAGLADGLNPCAISTLVFLVGMLSVSGVDGRRILVMGGPFCLAAFGTYVLIGWGLLRALYALPWFSSARSGLHLTAVGGLVILAALSFRDGCRLRRPGGAGRIALRLPGRIILRVHEILRRGCRARQLALGGFCAGALVTLLESICTGQMYLPTLVFMVRARSSMLRALPMLLAYNLCFVVPLMVALAAAAWGLRSGTLLGWSRRHAPAGKMLMGMVYLALGALLLVV